MKFGCPIAEVLIPLGLKAVMLIRLLKVAALSWGQLRSTTPPIALC